MFSITTAMITTETRSRTNAYSPRKRFGFEDGIQEKSMDGVKRENQPCKDVQSEGKDESFSRILYKKTASHGM